MLKRLLFIIILSTYFLPEISQAQYQLPKDNRYWKYYNWYVSHSIVNLVVSGKDEQQLSEALSEMAKLKKTGVLVGDIVVVGDPGEEDKIVEIGSKYQLGEPSLESSEAITQKYQINYSPTWIVRYRGKDYVYEGLRSPQGLFTSQGEFRNAN